MDYKVTRSKRKTMAIYVHKDANIEVRCSENLSLEAIDKFVASKQMWINRKVELMLDRATQREGFSLMPGTKLRLLGELYPIKEVQISKVGFDGNYFYIPFNFPHKDIKQCIIKLYKMLANKVLKRKVEEYSKIMNVSPSNVKINSANTRWGSCSSKNSINFSWKLIMATEKAIDYVVIHELAHTIEHNHSRNFWALVEKFMPEYNDYENDLKKLQTEISAQDWE